MKFKEYNQKQPWLIPPNIEDEIPAGDICRVIDEIVDSISLKSIEDKFNEEGNPAYHPGMMLKILLYSYAKGIYSSRKIAQELGSNIFFWYLSGKQKPNFRTICLFRVKHAEELKEVFREMIRLCLNLGIAKILTATIDGTKIKTSASREKIRSREWIEARIKEEDKAIEAALEKARLTDEEEDREYGIDKRGDELPEELRDPVRRREKLRRLKEEMAKRGKTLINETDHDAQLMKTTGGFLLGYNCQTVVDTESQLILAANVCTEGYDQHQLKVNIEEIKDAYGDKPEVLLADAGYSCGENIKYLKEENIYGLIPYKTASMIKAGLDGTLPENQRFKKDQFKYDADKDIYICPERKALENTKTAEEEIRKDGAIAKTFRYQCHDWLDCASRMICCRGEGARSIRRYSDEVLRQEMADRLRSKAGYALYKQRFRIAEPVFGNIKHNMGFKRFNLRGLIKTRGEFFLITMVHNLTKIKNQLEKMKTATGDKVLGCQLA
jgi:transposase